MSNVTEIKFVRVMPIPDEIMVEFYNDNIDPMDKFLVDHDFSRTKPLNFECGYIKKGKFKPIETKTVQGAFDLYIEKIATGDEEIVLCASQEGAPGGQHVH